MEPKDPVGVLENLNILFADDTPDCLHLVSRCLWDVGATVELAEDGEEAIAKVAGSPRPFDIVLLDLEMPKCSGNDAARRLRATGYAGVIIAVSAHAFREHRAEASEAGMDDYITKPFNRKTLIDTIFLAYAKKRLRFLTKPW